MSDKLTKKLEEAWQKLDQSFQKPSKKRPTISIPDGVGAGFNDDRVIKTLKESWNKMQVVESSLPPGFSPDDTIDITDELKSKETPDQDEIDQINEDALDSLDKSMPGGKVSAADIENIIGAKVDLPAIKADGVNPIDVLKAIQLVARYKSKKYSTKHSLSKGDPTFVAANNLVTKYAKAETTPSGKVMAPALKRARDIHTSNIVKYITYKLEDGTFNYDELAQQAVIPPKALLKQNDKMLHSSNNDIVFFDTKIAAYRGLYYDIKEKTFKIVKTCPSAGTCTKDCYAAKGNEVLFPSSNLNSIKTLTLMMNDYFEFKDKFVSEIQTQASRRSNKDKQIVIRWHSAGDFFTEKYFDIAIDIARECPDVDFYAYTKQIKTYESKKGSIPSNLSFILSEGGTDDVLTRKLMSADPSLKKSLIVPNPNMESGEWDTVKLRSDLQDPEYYEKFKTFLSQKYNLDKDLLITYTEMVRIPYDKKNIPDRKYKVIVIPGDGDTAAYRHDVDVVILLKH